MDVSDSNKVFDLILQCKITQLYKRPRQYELLYTALNQNLKKVTIRTYETLWSVA